MRNLHDLDQYRIPHPATGQFGDSHVGCFIFPSGLRVIAASGEGWDHVSVSLPDRTPLWSEMDQIKHAFFKAEETAFQLHVPAAQHINYHPFCLHLWRPHNATIPMPPSWMVA